jgi:hypothetical protein
MTTEDITLPSDNNWLAIPLTSEQTIIYNGSSLALFYRLGSLSSSNGMLFNKNETLIVDETIYIRKQYTSYSDTTNKVTVTR